MKIKRMKKINLCRCYCCGNKTIRKINNYEVCFVCGWIDDPKQSLYGDGGGANKLSFYQFVQRYYKGCDCPCCGEKTIYELGCYETCYKCAWRDDPSQSADPDCKKGVNKISLNEAKMLRNIGFPCPCCGKKTLHKLDNNEICYACNWIDDPVQSADLDYSDGANGLSLNKARELYNALFCCPCCGNPTIGDLGTDWICDICYWHDDIIQSDDPNYSGGANELSLNESRRIYFNIKNF